MSIETFREPDLEDKPSKTEAAAFVRALVRWVGPGFHPDTDFNDYVRGETSARSYSKKQAARLNAKLDRAIAALSQGDEDVYEIAAPVQHDLLAGYFGKASSVR